MATEVRMITSNSARGLVLVAAIACLVACGAVYSEPVPLQNTPTAAPKVAAAPPPAPPVATPPPAPPPPPPEVKHDPAHDRAAQLREAAGLLEQAEDARARDAKSYAEQLFSTAEMIVGSAALADIASRFRQGAPPRVETPLKALPKDSAPQPAVVGSSERDRPEPKPKKGALAGTLLLGGKAFSGDFGVVTLQPAGKNIRAFPTARIMEQRNRTFAPHVLVVPLGSVVIFPNFDPVFHNVFSASDTKPFDLGLYKSGEAREVLFDHEGTVRLACNLHANMSAFIVVVSAPHYVVTDSSGSFSFASLEPGKYTLKAYSERSLAPYTQEIEIKPGKNRVNVGVADDAPTGPLPDKFGVARVAKKS